MTERSSTPPDLLALAKRLKAKARQARDFAIRTNYGKQVTLTPAEATDAAAALEWAQEELDRLERIETAAVNLIEWMSRGDKPEETSNAYRTLAAALREEGEAQ